MGYIFCLLFHRLLTHKLLPVPHIISRVWTILSPDSQLTASSSSSKRRAYVFSTIIEFTRSTRTQKSSFLFFFLFLSLSRASRDTSSSRTISPLLLLSLLQWTPFSLRKHRPPMTLLLQPLQLLCVHVFLFPLPPSKRKSNRLIRPLNTRSTWNWRCQTPIHPPCLSVYHHIPRSPKCIPYLCIERKRKVTTKQSV